MPTSSTSPAPAVPERVGKPLRLRMADLVDHAGVRIAREGRR